MTLWPVQNTCSGFYFDLPVPEYTAIFKKFDRDGDGQIDADELASALSTFSKTAVSRERASRIIDDNDTNSECSGL